MTFHDSPFGGGPPQGHGGRGALPPNPFAPAGPSVQFAPPPGVYPQQRQSKFSDITPGDVILEVVASVLLGLALVVAWNREFYTYRYELPLVTLAMIGSVALSQLSLLTSYLGRLGQTVNYAGMRTLRAILNVPLLLLAFGFVGYDIVRKFVHLSAPTGLADYPGVGAGVWCAVAGAVLAAQPRAAERNALGTDWSVAGRGFVRGALVLSAFALVAVILGAVDATNGAASGERLGYVALLGGAALVAVVFAAAATFGLSQDYPGWRIAVSLFGATTLVVGLGLSFVGHLNNESDTRAGQSPPRSVYATAIPPRPEHNVPVIVVLDTSGSMDEEIDGGKTKIEAARSAVGGLIDNLDSQREFGMITYPDSKNIDDECGAGKIAVDFGELDVDKAHSAVDGVLANGGTPTGVALEQAAKILRDKGDEGVIVLVSDGISGCAQHNPCTVASGLTADKTGIQVNTVGFGLASSDAYELGCVADATGGQYIQAADSDELAKAMAELSTLSAPTVSASWLELFHGDGGYFALSMWIAAAAALAFSRGKRTGDARHPGFEWLDGCRHALTLVAVWNFGYAIIGVATALLGFNARTVGECVAVSFMLATCGLAALFGSSALRTDSGFAEEGPGNEALPSRELAVSACIGLVLLSIGRLVVEARPEINPPPAVLDAVMVALPAVVAVLILVAKPINDLYRLPQAQRAGSVGEQFGPFAAPSLASTAAASATNTIDSASVFAGSGSSGRSRGDADATTVADPRTSPADLYRIAQSRPDLRNQIAAHPNAYQGLRDWIRQQR